jgi:uncharacterized protein
VLLLIGLVAFLAVYNNATNLLGLPDSWYVPLNVLVGAALVAVARAAGLGWADLGFDPAALRQGVRWSAWIALAITAGLAVLLALPATRPLLADARVAGLGLGGLAYQTLLRIPIGTALFEEVAFRGVLLGVWTSHRGLAAAIVGSSVVFGLWHIGPTIVALDLNAVATTPGARVLAVTAACVVTGVAGAGFAWLRVVTGGLAAPVLVHAALNSLATVAAWIAHGR